LERSQAIAEHLDDFYTHMMLRWLSHEESLEKASKPVIETSKGHYHDLFERDKYPIKFQIGNDFRETEEDYHSLRRCSSLPSTLTRKLSMKNAIQLRRRRNSLISAVASSLPNMKDYISDDSDSSSSSSSDDESEDPYEPRYTLILVSSPFSIFLSFLLTFFLSFFSEVGSVGVDGQDDDSGAGSGEKKEEENEIDAALLEEEHDQNEDKTNSGVVQRVPSFHSSKHPAISSGNEACNPSHADVKDNDDDDESVTSLLDPQQALYGWYELVDKLKEDTLKKKSKVVEKPQVYYFLSSFLSFFSFLASFLSLVCS
jgi:hypothetical protein